MGKIVKKIRPQYWLILGVVAFVALVTQMRPVNSFIFTPHKTEPQMIVSTGTVHAGDTLERIMARYPMSRSDTAGILKAFAGTINMRRMKPGHSFELTTSTSGVFQQFLYSTDAVNSFVITRSSMNVFNVSKNTVQTVYMQKKVTADVTENLYKDMMKMGYDEPFVANLIADLADNIFAWRIDFFTEQRPGDHLEVLMEQEFAVGSDKPLWNGRGRILAAYYKGTSTRQKENYAFRYQPVGATQADYFDEAGKAVRKAFLRSPFVHGMFRVSSRFSNNRYHPILRVYRPHHGIDYASPYGSPVAAIGKGQVVYAGWKGGFGNCVEIRHSPKFTSRYGHLSRIGVHYAQSVNQGQFVGRVGNSGLSTGPHLHFELLVDGVQRNFLTMNFPAADSLKPEQLADFELTKNALLANLNTAKQDINLVAAVPTKQ